MGYGSFELFVPVVALRAAGPFTILSVLEHLSLAFCHSIRFSSLWVSHAVPQSTELSSVSSLFSDIVRFQLYDCHPSCCL